MISTKRVTEGQSFLKQEEFKPISAKVTENVRMPGKEKGIVRIDYLKLSIRIIASKASRGRNTTFRSTAG